MQKVTSALYLIPLLPLLGAAVNLLWSGRIPRRLSHFVAIGSVASSFGVACYLVGHDLFPMWEQWRASGAGESGATLAGLYQQLYTWIAVGDLNLELAFRMDTLSALLVLIITGVGLLIHIYSTGYMADERRFATYFGYLNLFTGAMLILVLADNLVVMFIGWEGVGLCSYLLIGFWFTNESFAYAGRKAFIVNRIGDFAFLLGICLLFWACGTLDFRGFQTAAALDAFDNSFLSGERMAMMGGLLLFIGAAGKSAQIPLYVWLPDAMAGPTPVSALIHAATMVTAGVYLVARMSFLYASSATAMGIVAGVGALTALFAAIMAFAQKDIKKVLAYSTVSQLGFMFVGVGVGAYAAGIFHLMTHAFFKAGLFLGAGSVMHAMSGSGNIMKMGGLRRHLPHTHWTFLIFCMAIAGVPIFAGFFSKDEILAGALAAHVVSWWPHFGLILWIVLTIAALGTAFYMFRLYFLVFWGDLRCDDETRAHIHESPQSMTVPLAILALLACFAGFLGLPHLEIPGIGMLPNFIASWIEPSVITPLPAGMLEGALALPAEPAGAREAIMQNLWPVVAESHLSQGWTVYLIVVAVAAALAGIYLAWMLYHRGPSLWIQRFTASGFGADLHRVVENKFYVDEAYDLIIIRPFRWLALTIYEVIDRFVIDLVFVNGSAFVVDVSGRVARSFQNGQVQRYLVALVVGAAAIFYFGSSPSIDIDYDVGRGTVVELRADLGGGPAEAGAEVAWDFDHDGRPDATEPVVTHDFGRPGEYEVTLWATDPVFGEEREVTRTITIPEQGGEE